MQEDPPGTRVDGQVTTIRGKLAVADTNPTVGEQPDLDAVRLATAA
jgi:hypothetical protein